MENNKVCCFKIMSTTKGEWHLTKHTFQRFEVDRIRLHVLPTEQFKTYAISVYIGWPLSEEWVTPVALAPFVMRRGSEPFPETQQFRERLDDLYGAGFGFDVYKRGDYQIVQFRMDIIEDQYVSDSSSLLKDAFQFLGAAVTAPAGENGRFLDKYVHSEKETVRKKLESMINDKIRYAAERCIEEMCSGEPYRLHPLGRIEDLSAYDSTVLYEKYRHWLNHAPMDIYVVGNVSVDEVSELVKTSFVHERQDGAFRYGVRPMNTSSSETKTIVERLEVNQGKLNMGLRTSVRYADDAYSAALMYNGILGAYPHSKLFTNVREKASLAYYASSRYDGHKGIITIQSGIEISNYEKAVRIIQEQLDAIRNGQISDLELEQTKAMITNQLRESQDSAFEIISFDFNSVLSERTRTAEQLIEEISSIDRQAIQAIAEQVKLDTIYFLRDEKGES
jgi:predicted Zn-dependent peptidase